MAATRSELANFYWYCAALTQVIEQLPGNAATRSVSRHALRNATHAIAGREGIRYATAAAFAAMEANGGVWERCGLLKEHTIPIGHIHQLLIDAIGAARSEAELQAASRRLADDMAADGLDTKSLSEFPSNPRIAFVADIIKSSTMMAWLTKPEEQRLRDAKSKGLGDLHRRMPPKWDGRDPFARYRACEIEVLPV